MLGTKPGAMDRILIGRYVRLELVYSERYTDGTADGKFDGMFLEDLFGSVDGLEISTNAGTELGLYDKKILGTKLGAMYGVSLGGYSGTKLGSSEYFTDGTVDRKFEGFLMLA